VTDSAGSGHVDLQALAEVDEGVAGPEVARAAHEHLEQCSECQDRLAHVRTTRALLSSLPADPMPAAVQARIDAALQRAATEPSGTVVPITGRSRPWKSPAVVGAAAAVAALVVIGALVAGNVLRANKSSSTAGSSAPLAGAGAPHGAASGAAGIKEWTTGANYTAATIPALVPRLVTGTPPAKAEGASGTSGSLDSNVTAAPAAPAFGAASGATTPRATSLSRRAMQTDPSALLACGTILAGGVPTIPVAVDFASWNGKPAVIFVLPAVGHADELDVWVVRSVCSTSSLDVYFRRIPRPTG